MGLVWTESNLLQIKVIGIDFVGWIEISIYILKIFLISFNGLVRSLVGVYGALKHINLYTRALYAVAFRDPYTKNVKVDLLSAVP